METRSVGCQVVVPGAEFAHGLDQFQRDLTEVKEGQFRPGRCGLAPIAGASNLFRIGQDYRRGLHPQKA
jgi:hypothetical protein